jgi:hypothetical protein
MKELKKLLISNKEAEKILKSQEEYKSDVGTFSIGLTKKEISMLVFWACIGVSKCKGGMYEKTIPKLLRYFSKQLKIKLPVKPEFINPTP